MASATTVETLIVVGPAAAKLLVLYVFAFARRAHVSEWVERGAEVATPMPAMEQPRDEADFFCMSNSKMRPKDVEPWS